MLSKRRVKGILFRALTGYFWFSGSLLVSLSDVFFVCTINVLKFSTQKYLTKWHMQILQTLIRLLLKEQFDQAVHFLPFHLVF